MTERSNVGLDGVTSMMAGPKRTLVSLTKPELSEVMKTYACPETFAGTSAMIMPLAELAGRTGKISRPETNVT